MRTRSALALTLLALAACEPSDGGTLLDIDGRAFVQGVVFRDDNASRSLDGLDQPAVNLSLALVDVSRQDTVARVRTAADGSYSFPLVPVGRYEVVIPPSALGDTLVLVYRDPPGAPVDQIGDDENTSLTLGIDDTATVILGVSYPVVSVLQARQLPTNRRVFVRGVALSPLEPFIGAPSLFLEGGTRGIRVTNVATDVVERADSLLMFGVTATLDGQPVIANGTPFVLAPSATFDTVALFASEARNAGGGLYDARLARVNDVVVADTQSTTTRFIMTVEDPSGTVEVSIPRGANEPEHVPGSVLDVIGVLVPKSGVQATWQLRPRTIEDIEVREP